MLIARCISALSGGPANETGRSPLSDSPVYPSLTPPVLQRQRHPLQTHQEHCYPVRQHLNRSRERRTGAETRCCPPADVEGSIIR